jgi:hypothetical protein
MKRPTASGGQRTQGSPISRSHVHQTHLTSGNGREHTTTAYHSQIPTEATALRKVLQADEERWTLLERRSPHGT